MVNAGKDGAEVGTRAQKPVECGKQSACPSNRKARTAARPSSSTPRLSPEARKPGAPSRAAHNSRRRKERSVCWRRAGTRLTGRYPAEEQVPDASSVRTPASCSSVNGNGIPTCAAAGSSPEPATQSQTRRHSGTEALGLCPRGVPPAVKLRETHGDGREPGAGAGAADRPSVCGAQFGV